MQLLTFEGTRTCCWLIAPKGGVGGGLAWRVRRRGRRRGRCPLVGRARHTRRARPTHELASPRNHSGRPVGAAKELSPTPSAARAAARARVAAMLCEKCGTRTAKWGDPEGTADRRRCRWCSSCVNDLGLAVPAQAWFNDAGCEDCHAKAASTRDPVVMAGESQGKLRWCVPCGKNHGAIKQKRGRDEGLAARHQKEWSTRAKKHKAAVAAVQDKHAPPTSITPQQQQQMTSQMSAAGKRLQSAVFGAGFVSNVNVGVRHRYPAAVRKAEDLTARFGFEVMELVRSEDTNDPPFYNMEGLAWLCDEKRNPSFKLRQPRLKNKRGAAAGEDVFQPTPAQANGYIRLLLVGEGPASVVYDAEKAIHQDGQEEKNRQFWHLIATQRVGAGGVAEARRDLAHVLCCAVIMDLPSSGLVRVPGTVFDGRKRGAGPQQTAEGARAAVASRTGYNTTLGDSLAAPRLVAGMPGVELQMYYCHAMSGAKGRSKDKWYSIATDGRGQIETRWENHSGAVGEDGAALPACGCVYRDYSAEFGHNAASLARDEADKTAKRKLKAGYKICGLVEPVAAAAAGAAAAAAAAAAPSLGDGSGAAAADSLETQDEWVQCEECEKWRILPPHVKSDSLPDRYICSMSHWAALSCLIPGDV